MCSTHISRMALDKWKLFWILENVLNQEHNCATLLDITNRTLFRVPVARRWGSSCFIKHISSINVRVTKNFADTCDFLCSTIVAYECQAFASWDYRSSASNGLRTFLCVQCTIQRFKLNEIWIKILRTDAYAGSNTKPHLYEYNQLPIDTTIIISLWVH